MGHPTAGSTKRARAAVAAAVTAAWALAGAMAAQANGANIALPSVNPAVGLAGAKYPSSLGYGLTAVTGEINDGNLGFSWNVFMGTTFLHTMGYDLGAVGTVNEVRIYQETQGGTRKRLKDVDVFTSAGKFSFTDLPDADVVSLALPGVSTSYVMVMPVAKQDTGTDHNLGIREIEVYSTTPAAPRINWAAGVVPTSTGGYNSGSMAALTDGNLYATAIYKNPGGSAVFDLGQERDVGGVGIAHSISTNSRKVWQDVLVEFSNDGTFTDIAETCSFTLFSQLHFQQWDFLPVTARYVRLTDSGRQLVGGAEWDNNTQLFEIQLLSPNPALSAPVIPEPASAALMALGACALARRRRRR